MKNTFVSSGRTFWIKQALALLSTAGLLASNLIAAIPGPEKLLPDDTLAVISAPDFAKLRDAYASCPQAQFWNDPAMKPFKDKFLSKLRDELLQPLERELGVSMDDYANLPQGQLTLAVTQNGWQGASDQQPGVLLLLDARNRSSQLKTNIAVLRRKWTEAGNPIRTEKIRDIEFSVLPLSEKSIPQSLKKTFGSSGDTSDSSEDQTNQAPKSELVIGQFESLLIIGNSTKAVEKIVIHLTGGSMPSLGDTSAFESSRLSVFRESPFYCWINVKSFIDVFTKHVAGDSDSENANPFAMLDLKKIFQATGLSGVRTFAFGIQNSSDGVLGQFTLGVPDANRQGLLKLFPGEPKESSPPPFVPATAVKFQRYRIDGQKAWTTVEKMLNDASPQIAAVLNSMLDSVNTTEQQKDPNFDIRKNLIGNLGDDLIDYEKAANASTLAQLNAAPSLFLLGSPHPDQLAAAFKTILVFASGSPNEREFLGRKIYSLPLPSAPLAGGEPGKTSSTLYYAPSASYVAITTDVSMLEEYLRNSDNQQKALRDTPGLSDAIAKAGGSSTGWFGYENQVETTRSVLEVLKKSATESKEQPMLAPGIPAFIPESSLKEWFDFSLLPPFEKISKYFHFSVYSGSANVDGLSIKFFSPVPPALKK